MDFENAAPSHPPWTVLDTQSALGSNLPRIGTREEESVGEGAREMFLSYRHTVVNGETPWTQTRPGGHADHSQGG